MIKINEIIAHAIELGFKKAAVISTKQLVYIPEYRKYCEENVCGNYNLLPVCPPNCGTTEEMYQRLLKYTKVLVLQTEMIPEKWEKAYYLAGKKQHNKLTDKLLELIAFDDYLVMSAGPWKNASCMSAYSIDAAKMAESCNMSCWEQDGKLRFFSSVLFND